MPLNKGTKQNRSSIRFTFRLIPLEKMLFLLFVPLSQLWFKLFLYCSSSNNPRTLICQKPNPRKLTLRHIHPRQIRLSYLPNPSAWAGYDTRSIFKQSLTGLNSEFSFSKTSCLTKPEEPSLPYYLPIAGGRLIGFIPFPRVLVLCEMQSVMSRI